MKKLPSVFANKIEKKISNNSLYSVTRNNDGEPVEVNKKDINQKINSLFNSSKYVYKVDVLIKLKDKEVAKKIIGKVNNNLITIDNESIPISEIYDINFK